MTQSAQQAVLRLFLKHACGEINVVVLTDGDQDHKEKKGHFPVEARKTIVEAMRAAMLREGERLAYMAWEETGIGRAEDKVIKNRLVTVKTPGVEALVPRTWSGDRGLTLMEWAPFGVIGAITPTTNPTETILCNGIGMLSDSECAWGPL